MKKQTIRYVVEGLKTGNTSVDRLHVKSMHVIMCGRTRYFGWTDTGKRCKWYSSDLVGATKESAVKKALKLANREMNRNDVLGNKYNKLACNYFEHGDRYHETTQQLLKWQAKPHVAEDYSGMSTLTG